MEQRTYKKGEVIFRQGSYGAELFEVYGGSVGIFANYGEPNEKRLVVLGPEQYFGEMGLVEARPRSATAVALEPCTLAVVSADTFADYFKERPAKVLVIMSSLSARLRTITDDYVDACKTIAEAVKAEDGEKSGWLKTQLTKFSDLYHSGMDDINSSL